GQAGSAICGLPAAEAQSLSGRDPASAKRVPISVQALPQPTTSRRRHTSAASAIKPSRRSGDLCHAAAGYGSSVTLNDALVAPLTAGPLATSVSPLPS